MTAAIGRVSAGQITVGVVLVLGKTRIAIRNWVHSFWADIAFCTGPSVRTGAVATDVAVSSDSCGPIGAIVSNSTLQIAEGKGFSCGVASTTILVRIVNFGAHAAARPFPSLFAYTAAAGVGISRHRLCVASAVGLVGAEQVAVGVRGDIVLRSACTAISVFFVLGGAAATCRLSPLVSAVALARTVGESSNTRCVVVAISIYSALFHTVGVPSVVDGAVLAIVSCEWGRDARLTLTSCPCIPAVAVALRNEARDGTSVVATVGRCVAFPSTVWVATVSLDTAGTIRILSIAEGASGAGVT